MHNEALLGPWVRRFLLEHVVAERNLARNTQQGYRDGLCQLIPFIAKHVGKSIDCLHVVDLSADQIRSFLADIEVTRRCSIATRNQRLAAVRAFAGFVGEHSPIHIEWSGQIRSIPFKKTHQALVPYLEKAEIDALLAAPDRRTEQGRRDYALLLFLYNTGARASEAACITVADLNLKAASVKINGKGGKQRYCPLWSATIAELQDLIADGATFYAPESTSILFEVGLGTSRWKRRTSTPRSTSRRRQTRSKNARRRTWTRSRNDGAASPP